MVTTCKGYFTTPVGAAIVEVKPKPILTVLHPVKLAVGLVNVRAGFLAVNVYVCTTPSPQLSMTLMVNWPAGKLEKILDGCGGLVTGPLMML